MSTKNALTSVTIITISTINVFTEITIGIVVRIGFLHCTLKFNHQSDSTKQAPGSIGGDGHENGNLAIAVGTHLKEIEGNIPSPLPFCFLRVPQGLLLRRRGSLDRK